MSGTWFDRFVEVVEADGRSLAEISRAANLGQNFVQQAIKNRKVPSVEKLIAVLGALGSASTLYVIADIKMDRDDEAFLHAALSLDDDLKAQARGFFEKLQAPRHNSGPLSEPPPASAATHHKD